MMSTIYDVLVAAGSWPAASIAAKATVITTLALIAARLARRSRAAARHALLTAAFGALLVLPIVATLARPVRIAVPAGAQKPAAPPPFQGGAGPKTPVAPAGTDAASAGPRFPGLSPSDLLLAGWIAGMAVFLLPVVMGLREVRSLRRSAVPWPRGQSLVEAFARDAGIHRRIGVLLHETLSGPMTCGIVNPAIVLPRDAEMWDAEDLNRAIVHELEHVRRGDWLSNCLARAVCAVYWFHPLVWMAWRGLALEAERSCDDAVLGCSEATAYADQLVRLARRLSTATKSPLLAMANRADLTTRVSAVLDGRQHRGRAGAFPVALVGVAAAMLVLTLSPLKMVAAPQTVDTGATPAGQISVDTLLVVVTVTVDDRNGRSVEGLGVDDFAVSEDGVSQTIATCEFQKAAPGTPDSVFSYYILGYYTRNHNADGQFRKIEVIRKGDPAARLHYRAGYYPRPSDSASPGGMETGRTNDVVPYTTVPVLFYKVDPEYAEAARKAKYQGTVILAIEVDTSGHVANMTVKRALGLDLDEKAMDAVRQWRFRPATRDGKVVPVQVQVRVNFRLL